MIEALKYLNLHTISCINIFNWWLSPYIAWITCACSLLCLVRGKDKFRMLAIVVLVDIKYHDTAGARQNSQV